MIAKHLFLTALASATLFAQGSLTPPTGPAPSMKTLGQIEPRIAIEKLPFKISAAGAYYVTTNLAVPSGQNGITIDASQVTLDLNGFTVSGPADSEVGISIIAGRSDVSIRNGVVSAGAGGIVASGGSRIQLEAIRATTCGGSGISVGTDSSVLNCVAAENSATGIRAGNGSTVANSQAIANGANGIEAGQKCVVRDSVATRNGLAGILVGDYSKVIGASASDNNGAGLSGGAGVHFTDCSANANKQQGILAGQLAFVTRANTSGNAHAGVHLSDSGTVMDSASSANGGGGIVTGVAAHVANCKVDSNPGVGISVQKGSTVRDCSAQRNSNDGIVVTDQCLVVRNNANANSNLKGAAGIHVKGTDNLIQENIAIANDRGIALDAEGNLVIKNSSTNNSLNFFTAGDQMIGPVLDTLDTGEAINPLSNFTY
jgi:hypothetical protein